MREVYLREVYEVAFILNGLSVGIRFGFIVVGVLAGLVLGCIALLVVIAIISQIVALFAGEPRQKDGEDTKDAE